MRSLILAMALIPTVAAADEPQSQADVETTIQRGLAFLVKDALAWKAEHNCVSCHHAGLVVWALREAKVRGHTVDQTALDELTRWVAESGDGKTSIKRPEGIPKALNTKAVNLALALGADPLPDSHAQEGLQRLVETILGDQTDNGLWASWPETRPPIFGNSDDTMTSLATLALVPSAAAGSESAKSALARGLKWLTGTKTDDDPQSVAMRLVVLSRLQRSVPELLPLIARIRSRQNADGGFSQAAGMPSDAWATGQALYALAQAGITRDDPAIRRAQRFLARSQREDGSWLMASRPMKPGGEGAKSLVPIIGAGSSWAVLGLVRSRSP